MRICVRLELLCTLYDENENALETCGMPTEGLRLHVQVSNTFPVAYNFFKCGGFRFWVAMKVLMSLNLKEIGPPIVTN